VGAVKEGRRRPLGGIGSDSNELLHEGEKFAGNEWTRFFASGISNETPKAFCFSLPDRSQRWVPKAVCRVERVAGGALLVKIPIWFAKQEGIPL
jgi:hypothetical protein